MVLPFTLMVAAMSDLKSKVFTSSGLIDAGATASDQVSTTAARTSASCEPSAGDMDKTLGPVASTVKLQSCPAASALPR